VTTDTWHKIGVLVSTIALGIAILACIAAWLVVPEIRGVFSLNDTGTPQPTPTSRTTSSAPTQSEKPIDRYSVRVFNCDDACRAFIQGRVVAASGFGEDSGWVDVTDAVRLSPTSIRFQVLNSMGAIAYGFQVRKNKALIFEQVCGTASVEGCEGNRQDFPIGVGREFQLNVRGP
jgi:hypothetical protein